MSDDTMTPYDGALADARLAYENWTLGQRREADSDFATYQALGGRSPWLVWLARYRYDYEFAEEAGQ